MDRFKVTAIIATLYLLYSLERLFHQQDDNIVHVKAKDPTIERFLFKDYAYLDLWNLLTDYKSIWYYKNENKIGRKDINDESMLYFQRTIQRIMRNSLEEREKKLQNLTNIFLKTVNELQNPAKCSRVLICEIEVICGFGCYTHHLTNCMLEAFYTMRTMIYVHQGWGYDEKGWENPFQTISNCSLDKELDISTVPYMEDVPWGAKIVKSHLNQVPSWVPFTVSTEFSEVLLSNHGDPFAWWIGQVVSYLMRPQPWLVEMFEQRKRKLRFSSPCVGIQIRRGDKLEKESQFFTVDEYMYYVDKWFDQKELDTVGYPRTVYVATEDPSVLPELRKKYPDYNFITNQVATTSIKTMRDRYIEGALESVLMDIFFLSQCDFIVCTLSSNVCRVSYELMQNVRADAAERIQSLDIPYRFKWSLESRWEAIADHLPSKNSGELRFLKGSTLLVPFDHNTSFKTGYLNGSTNLNQNFNKPFPRFKARQKIQTISYRIFKNKI